MSKIKVRVTVGVHPKTKQHVARVVKATFDELDNRVLEKRILSHTGKWLRFLPGSTYPDNTAFNVTVGVFAIED